MTQPNGARPSGNGAKPRAGAPGVAGGAPGASGPGGASGLGGPGSAPGGPKKTTPARIQGMPARSGGPPWMGAGLPAEKPMTFWPSARRLMRRLSPYRARLIAIVSLGVSSVSPGTARCWRWICASCRWDEAGSSAQFIPLILEQLGGQSW